MWKLIYLFLALKFQAFDLCFESLLICLKLIDKDSSFNDLCGMLDLLVLNLLQLKIVLSLLLFQSNV